MLANSRFSPEQIEEKRQHCIAEFRRYQTEYIDDLPEKRLAIWDPNYYLYKCRTNFFNSVSLRIIILLKHWVLEEDENISEFFWYMNNERNWLLFATNHDIHRVNTVIERVIEILESDSEKAKLTTLKNIAYV